MIAVSTFSIGFPIHENIILYNAINFLEMMSFIELDTIRLVKLTYELKMSAINITATRTK